MRLIPLNPVIKWVAGRLDGSRQCSDAEPLENRSPHVSYAFHKRFPDDAACARFLVVKRVFEEADLFHRIGRRGGFADCVVPCGASRGRPLAMGLLRPALPACLRGSARQGGQGAKILRAGHRSLCRRCLQISRLPDQGNGTRRSRSE